MAAGPQEGMHLNGVKISMTHSDGYCHKSFLCKLTEHVIIRTKWHSGDDNPVRIFTKTFQGPLFEKCVAAL